MPRKKVSKSKKPIVAAGPVMYGDGFWDDVWGGIKSVGSFVGDKVLPKVVDIGLPLAVKALTGAGKRRRMRGKGIQKKKIIKA
ncbi:hypothetical protein [Candidatus Finniella inopinata]|uniref:Uncharacterized protein n=1 Tax=Candidatus Finniella inopinata TaxID=1696036 RepID=A0A4Q7DF87_9PROT|nr:hypothetical protein [Candidatus Finniella inopinata]RZI45302.1 hypothetical protein EQU50_07635 [Candidatus Finniella inopinata]